MKKTFTIFIFLLVLQVSVFSQTKFDEYSFINTDEESGRIDGFLVEMQNNPQAKGLFLVYLGEKKIRIGNILTYHEGVKKYISLRGFEIDRVSFFVSKGKETFSRELWIINKGDKLPKFEKSTFDLKELEKRILYATFCNECSPAVLTLRTDVIDWDLLAKLLKENPDYKILLQLGKSSHYYDVESDKEMNSKKYVKVLLNRFSEKYKINKNRIKYNISNKSEFGIVNIFIEK